MSAAFSIPPERGGRAADPDLAERRKQMAQGVAAGVFATKRPADETTLAGLRCLRFAPEGEPRAYWLQLHGGGFRIGRPEFEAPLMERLSKRCQVAAAIPQYRLAPEGPFPAGLNDALAALNALAGEADGAPLIVGGDSAGGGLAASLGALSQAGLAPKIDALVLLSPWLDLTVSAPSYAVNAASDQMFSKESADIAAELYLQGFDPAHPLVSPLLADLDSYPPTFISVGNGEVLRDDSLRFHEKLAALGTRVKLSAIDDMPHVAVVLGPEQIGAAETFESVAAFVDEVLGS
jgi:epsilon-lactone hydrolase